MLHPYQEASKRLVPWAPGQTEGGDTHPAGELLAMLREINRWLEGATPHIQSSLLKNAVSVYVLYRNVAYTPEDFWDLFGRSMGRINADWPICAFGTAENQETVRLTAAENPKGIELVQQSISGKSADVMRTLCLQIDCSDNATAEILGGLLRAADWETNIVALSSWKWADFLREQDLFIQTDPQGFFCYGSVNQEVTAEEMLDSLDFSQKIILWRAFLKDGFDPAEFEWISQSISEGRLDNRLEWELALWEALDQLEFRMVNREKTFELFDGKGERVYFGADGGSVAGRVFLKILFPLNY